MFEPLPNKHTLQTKNENEILVRYGGTIGGQFYGYTTYKIDIKTSNKNNMSIAEEPPFF